jgi:uncharacterized protein (TIGR03083 family)
MMSAHTAIAELLGAWALDACDEAETAAVDEHLAQCAECAEQARMLRSAAGWLSAEDIEKPRPTLRAATLARARAARAPTLWRTLVGAYGNEVDRLDEALGSITSRQWAESDPRHGTVAGLITHLAGNDAMLADDLGLPVLADSGVHARWRDQADVLLTGISGDTDLDRPVRMAAPGEPPRRPLREALVQRAFETWTHLDDLAAALQRTPPPPPPPEQVRRIIDLAVTLLPDALAANGVSQPGRACRLVLTGAAGGEWTIPLGHPSADTPTITVTVTSEDIAFARLVANRRTPETMRYRGSGDTALAERVLRIASALGCD